MKNFFLITLFLLLAACGSKSGDGGGGNENPKQPDSDSTENVLDISLSKSNVFFGLTDLSQNSANQEVLLTAINASGVAQADIQFSGDESDFVVSPSGCNVTFSKNQTCLFTLRFEPQSVGLRTLTIKITTPNEVYSNDEDECLATGGVYSESQETCSKSKEKNISLFGVGANFDGRLAGLRISLVDGQLAEGSWQDSIDFDFFGTQLISKTLLELDKKIGLPGLFNQAETGVLNYTQDYFSLIDDGMGSDVLIDFDLDKEEQNVVWDFPRTGPDGLFVKEIPFTLLDTLSLFNDKQGFFGGNYLSELDSYIDSRRLSGNISSMAAQYAYAVSEGSDRYGNGNYHRILSDISFLMDSLLDRGKTQKAQELAQIIYQNYDFSANDLRTDNVVNLSYNSNPFVFTNPGEYVEVNNSDSILDKIYENSFIDCRIHGQAILLLSKAYQAGGFSAQEEIDILGEISFEWDNFNNTHSSGDFLGGACKPIRARISANLPAELLDIPEISVIYLDLLDEIDDGDEINDLAPFLIGETLKALEELLFY